MHEHDRGPRRLEEGWFDASVPLREGMAQWPGDPQFVVSRAKAIRRGDKANLSEISTCVHLGTHMDAPEHFIDGAAGMDGAPLDALIGEARIVDVDEAEVIEEGHLHPFAFRAGERVLFRTRNSRRPWWDAPFDERFVAFSHGAAEHLARCRLRLVGIDYLSVGRYGAADGPDVHRALLSAGVWIIEGLDLTKTSAGHYEMICLPMKLVGSDGAPARVLLRPIA